MVVEWECKARNTINEMINRYVDRWYVCKSAGVNLLQPHNIILQQVDKVILIMYAHKPNAFNEGHYDHTFCIFLVTRLNETH